VLKLANRYDGDIRQFFAELPQIWHQRNKSLQIKKSVSDFRHFSALRSGSTSLVELTPKSFFAPNLV